MAGPKVYPVIDESKCTNCDKCILACPVEAIYKQTNYSCSRCMKYCISMDVPCSPHFYFFNYRLCDACGKCIEVCPEGAISFSEENL